MKKISEKAQDDDADRCVVFDLIYLNGPMDRESLCKTTGHHPVRLGYLINHEWFKVCHGMVYLATVKGGAGRPDGRVLLPPADKFA